MDAVVRVARMNTTIDREGGSSFAFGATLSYTCKPERHSRCHLTAPKLSMETWTVPQNTAHIRVAEAQFRDPDEMRSSDPRKAM